MTEFFVDDDTDPALQPPRIVMPAVEKWLAEGSPRTKAAQERLNSVMAADAAGRASGKGRLRSSKIGGCLRQQAYSLLGVPESDEPDLEAHSRMNAGTWLHYYFQLSGLSAGWLRDIEVPAVLPITERVDYVGAIDGILSDGSIFELKSASWGTFKKWSSEPNPHHVMQVTGYMIAKDVNYATIVYSLRDNPLRSNEFRVTLTQENEDRFFSECERVAEVMYDPKLLPTVLPECVMGDGQSKWCNWRTHCNPSAQS